MVNLDLGILAHPEGVLDQDLEGVLDLVGLLDLDRVGVLGQEGVPSLADLDRVGVLGQDQEDLGQAGVPAIAVAGRDRACAARMWPWERVLVLVGRAVDESWPRWDFQSLLVVYPGEAASSDPSDLQTKITKISSPGTMNLEVDCYHFFCHI